MDLLAYPNVNFEVLYYQLAQLGVDIDKRAPGSIQDLYEKFDMPPSSNGLVQFIIGETFKIQELVELINLQVPLLYAWAYMDTVYILIRGTASELTRMAIGLSQSKFKYMRARGNSLSTMISASIDKTAFQDYLKNDLGDGTYSWRKHV